MMILLEGVLAAEDVARVVRGLDAAPWQDGRATAGRAARAVKQNQQAVGDDPDVQSLGRFVTDALRRHPLFDLAVRPRRMSRLLFSRYSSGETYGPHTDDALMGEPPFRSDVAFTLFLADPASYQGGALTISTPLGDQAIRLAAGDAVIYSAGTVHWVAPVTDGVRLAAVGWAQSFVRDPAQRELLFDLATARARCAEAGLARETLLLLDRTQSNLLRMWAEP
ncbi:MAG: Fe2+-dependent dioxygenase [Hyphomonadaceae bacterium]|nr:Fe2+-dependent dioxygenase [Hyphomonadaceae bacterium]